LIEPTSFQAIGWMAVIVFSAAGGVNQVSAAIERWRGRPSAELLEKEMQQANARLVKLEAEIKELEKRMATDRNEASERRRKIYEKIEDMRSEVKEDIKGIHSRLDLIFQTSARP